MWTYSANNRNQKFELIPVGTSARAFGTENAFNATPIIGRRSELSWAYDQIKEVEQYVIQYATEYDYEFADLDSIDVNDKIDFNSYEYIHNTPVTGANFYQIKIKFLDGSIDFLPFRNVEFAELVEPVTIFPNPTQDLLFIDLSLYMDTKINYFVSSAKGQILMSGEFSKDHPEREMLDLSGFENGAYYIYIRPERHREITQQFNLMNLR